MGSGRYRCWYQAVFPAAGADRKSWLGTFRPVEILTRAGRVDLRKGDQTRLRFEQMPGYAHHDLKMKRSQPEFIR